MDGFAVDGVTGIVLAGGLGRRMGGVDKGLQLLHGKPMVEHVLARLTPQVDEIVINANQNRAAYGRFGHRVAPDEIAGFAGPLAGLHAGMKAASHSLVVTVPCDSPFLPDDLVECLHQARRKMGAGVPLACARSGEWRHPVVGLWPLALREDLRKALVKEDLRKIEVWTARHGVAIADWPDQPIDPFFNVNTPEDAARAARIALQHT